MVTQAYLLARRVETTVADASSPKRSKLVGILRNPSEWFSVLNVHCRRFIVIDLDEDLAYPSKGDQHDMAEDSLAANTIQLWETGIGC